MAVKNKDWKIVTLKQLKKKPTKAALKKSLVNKKVYWIEQPSTNLYVWTILKDNNNWTVNVSSLNRNLKANPKQTTDVRTMSLHLLTFEKK